MRPEDTFEGRALIGEQEYLDSLPQRGMVQTTCELRNGTRVKCLVEAGHEPPVKRDAAVSLLRRALVWLPSDVAVRSDIVRALARERRRVGGLLLAALLLTAAPALAQHQVSTFTSKADGTGAYTVLVSLPGPVTVVPSNDLRWEYQIDVPVGAKVERLWSFIGDFPGDRLEAGIDVVTVGGFHLHQRSEHRETAGQYDAWKAEDVGWVSTREDHTLRIVGTGHCTGGAPVVLHWELRLRMRQVGR
jgi:hypothetical protein